MGKLNTRSVENTQEGSTSQLIGVASLFSAVAYSLFGLLYYFYLDFTALSVVNVAATTLCLLLFFFFRKSSGHLCCAHALLFINFCALFLINFFLGAHLSPTIHWILAIIVGAGVLLNNRYILYWSSASLATPFALYLLAESPLKNYIFPLSAQQHFLLLSFSFVGLSLFLGHFIYIYARENKRIVDSLNSKNLEIATMVRILEHDISTPLTIAQNSIKKLDLSDYPDALKKACHRLKTSLISINSILTTVRFLDRINSGKIAPKASLIPLHAALTESVSQLEDRYQNKNISIHINIPLDAQVFADHDIFVNQISTNLLTNAIKFTPINGSIDLSCQQIGESMAITFRDSGVGISADDIHDIFSSSINTNKVGTEGEKGNGLGLPIVKSCVEKLGGTISVESSEVGTSFRVELRAPRM